MKSKFMQRLEETYPHLKKEEKLHTPKNWISGLITIGVLISLAFILGHFIIKYW